MTPERTEEQALVHILEELIKNWESEIVEFKQAGKDYSTDKIGEYFSALANEANLRNLESAWLIFGVNDKNRSIIGSKYLCVTSAYNAQT